MPVATPVEFARAQYELGLEILGDVCGGAVPKDILSAYLDAQIHVVLNEYTRLHGGEHMIAMLRHLADACEAQDAQEGAPQ
jgi:hypothetical protein